MITLAELNSMAPATGSNPAVLFALATQQASRLLQALGVEKPPLSIDLLMQTLAVGCERIPALGVSSFPQLTPRGWVILLNATDAFTRQRFSFCHALKHIIDDVDAHGRIDLHERVADYFAACLLMPGDWVQSEWSKHRSLAEVARSMQVSVTAMSIRLAALGISSPSRRILND